MRNLAFLALAMWIATSVLLATETAGIKPTPRKPANSGAQASTGGADRVKKLEQQVAELQAQVRELIKMQGPQLPAQTQLPGPAPVAAPSQPQAASGGGALSDAEKAALEAEFSGAMGGAKGAGSVPAPVAAPSPAIAPPSTAAATAATNATKPSASIPTPAIVWNPAASTPAPAASGAGGGRLRLIDLSVSLLNDLTGSTASESELRRLNHGDHDPKNHGFTAPNEEFVMGGVVDQNFRGDLVIVPKINFKGDTEVEIEEAYLTALNLGHGLGVKAGTWFSDFGRLNNSHPHQWDFANQPVVYSRLLSKDNQKSPGAEINWLLPSDDYYKLYFTALSPVGGSMQSFRGGGANDLTGRDEENQIGGHAFGNFQDRGLRDLTYLTRLETSRDLSDEMTILMGGSFETGPNATGQDARTRIFGFDFYGKWKPLNNDHGWPFWSWQAEVLKRSYGAAASPLYTDPTITLPNETLNDWGFYAQVMHGFKRQWTAGLRLDYANGDGANALDPLRDRRWRVSPNITHYFSEFSKLRYQYDFDVAEHLGDKPEHTFTVQYEVNFGAHGAHKF
ncbi:MAG: hypothetical protein HY303_17960 [Candidatus Wallbacteria bacterium]|nr:hypothetical protein [Candidatus Wallbacteria bacterium]